MSNIITIYLGDWRPPYAPGQRKLARREVAKALGYRSINALGVSRVLDHLVPGEVILGTRLGTAKYLGPIVHARVRKTHPGMTRMIPFAYGRFQGDDRIAIIGHAPVDPTLH